MSQYNEAAGRSQAQIEKMRDLAKRGICIFCPEYIHEDSQKIEFQTGHWMVKKNSYPYDGAKLHIVLIPKRHVKTVSELPKVAQAEFLALVARCEKVFLLKSYAVAMRSGDIHFNGGSVEHLHAHLVVGDTDDPHHEPIRFKMSSRPR